MTGCHNYAAAVTETAATPGARFESPVVARTRLVPPRIRAETVERPELVARRLASPARLGVVSGPAGCGKSTLLAQCHSADPFPAWLSFGGSDNDPVVMWWAIIAALRTVIGGFGDDYRNRLLIPGLPAVLDDVVASVADELAERETPVHLFLDDLHLVDNTTCRRTLRRLLSMVPAGVRVTVASREALPLPLARLRVDGELVEIDAADLALSRSQTERLLTELGVSVDPDHLDLLVARTEGWPAGLHLAAMALVRSDDPAGFVEDFHGTDRDVADYLVGEVLESVSNDERDFMIQTSALGRLTGALCDAATERTDSAELLAHLERSNAFVVALDRDGASYRYHHLFAELLAAELRRSHHDVGSLHRRAFAWLRHDGQVAAAIPHALAAGDTDAAADLLSRHWFDLMDRGQLETVRSLLARFAPEDIEGHQPLEIAAAIVHGMAGEPHEARRCLDAAERATYDRPPPDGSATMTSSLALARATLALDGIDAALTDGRTTYGLEPVGSRWRTLAALDIGLALVMRGDVEESTPFLEEVERTGDHAMRVYALAELALGQLARGDAEQAALTAASANQIVLDDGLDDLIMAAVTHAAATLAAIEIGDERAARVSLRAASRPMESVGHALPMDSIHVRLLVARAAISLGEIDIARRYLDDARRVADTVTDIGAMREELAELQAQVDEAGRGGEEDGGPEFTERELEVIALLPTSLTNREIGEELFLSRNTIKTYLRRVYGKLHASSREEAVLLAGELGLLDDGPPRSVR